MQHSISEKLDFLMKLTNTQNAALGRALSYDASYISRIRNNKRGLPLQQPFIDPAAEFFAGIPLGDYQKNALSQELGIGRPWPEDKRDAATLLAAWLRNELDAGAGILKLLSTVYKPALEVDPNKPYKPSEPKKAEALMYFGNKGKQDSVIKFLSDIKQSGGKYELLLYSDEDMSWMYEDENFTMAWSALMLGVMENGCRIKIIHSLSRNANDMFEAVKKWMPLYLSGSIEPYYYPRIRDGVFMRTMFIARGHSAIISQSTAGQSEAVLNIYLEEESVVKAMESEFDAFLGRCKPLMRTMKALEKTKLEELLSSFEEVPGDARIIRVDAAGAAVCLKQSAALVLGLKNPYSAFVINEPRMIAAMTEYIDNLPVNSVSIKDIRDIVD